MFVEWSVVELFQGLCVFWEVCWDLIYDDVDVGLVQGVDQCLEVVGCVEL